MNMLDISNALSEQEQHPKYNKNVLLVSFPKR